MSVPETQGVSPHPEPLVNESEPVPRAWHIYTLTLSKYFFNIISRLVAVALCLEIVYLENFKY